MRRGNDNRDLLPWRYAAATTRCRREKKVKGVVFKKFLYLYAHIWSQSAQNRKEFSLNPIQGCADVSTRAMCFVQGCYWMLASSSPRDGTRAVVVVKPWTWHKQNLPLTSVLQDMFLIVIYELILCSSPKIPAFAVCHPSILQQIGQVLEPASLQACWRHHLLQFVVKGRDGSALSYSQLSCCGLGLIP